MKTEAMKCAKFNYNRNIKAHLTNEDTATTQRMRAWIRKARIFRENAGNSKHQDTINV